MTLASDSPVKSTRPLRPTVDLSAGSDLLAKYEAEWVRIYRHHLDVIHNAKVADRRTQAIVKMCDEKLASWERLAAQVQSIPQTIDVVNKTSLLVGTALDVREATFN